MLQNLKFGIFPSFSFKVEYTDKGFYISYGESTKRLKGKKKLTNKLTKKALSKVDLSKLATIRFKSIDVVGFFGASDAAQTAIITGGIKSAVILLLSAMPKAEKNRVFIVPSYDRQGLNLNFKISLQFNLLIIIFLSLNILTNTMTKRSK